MTDPKNKLVRVELEFEDGEIKRLTGAGAREWEDMCDNAFVMAHIHGCVYKELQWEILKEGGKKDASL